MVSSQKHADFACKFFEAVLCHTADDWWGEPFLLCGWQEKALSEIFGNLDEHDNRIIEMVYLEVPKKAGKTEFAAGLALLTLVSTNTPGCQVYGAAAATRQALQVYRAACKMIEQSSWLRKRLRIMRGTHRILKRKDPDSFYAAVAADGDFGDGVNPAFVVADEVHRWKTRKQIENWDVLSKGGITRRQTLTIAITTAGVQNESPLAWKLHEKTRRIEEGIVTDHRFYGKIYGAAAEDDPADPATWYKANPSLVRLGEDGKVIDGFITEDKIRKEYESAESEGDLTSFKRYFLNIWDQKENRALEMAKWDASAGEWKTPGLLPRLPEDKVRTLPHDFMARFFQRTCWAGVDLSMTTDLTSVVFLFPGDEDSYDVLPFFWVPEARPQAGTETRCAAGAVDPRRLSRGHAGRGDRLSLRAGSVGVGLPDVRHAGDLLGPVELAPGFRGDGRRRLQVCRDPPGLHEPVGAQQEDPGDSCPRQTPPRRTPGAALECELPGDDGA